jgi:toxin ParE1/3/4
MAVRIEWSGLALDDVDEIARFISRDSVVYAKAMVSRFFEAVELLKDFPKGGRVVPEREDERYRELIVRPYRVIYRLFDDRVEILAVVHGARLLERAAAARLPPQHP